MKTRRFSSSPLLMFFLSVYARVPCGAAWPGRLRAGAEAHFGHSIQGCKAKFFWILEKHLSLRSEFNAAALEALRVFQGLQFASVPSMPGPGWSRFHHQGDICSPSLAPLGITFLPLFLSHSHIPTFPSNFSISFHHDLPAQGPLEGCSHQQWQRLGQKSPAGGRGEELIPFFGSRSDWNSDDPTKAAGSISS